jgi:hypothetical protein
MVAVCVYRTSFLIVKYFVKYFKASFKYYYLKSQSQTYIQSRNKTFFYIVKQKEIATTLMIMLMIF